MNTIPNKDAPYMPPADSLEDNSQKEGPDRVDVPAGHTGDATAHATPLGQQTDRHAFSLAPLYQLLGVDFSLTHQFAAEIPSNQSRDFLKDLETIELPREVFNSRYDSNVLQTLSSAWYKHFFDWLSMAAFKYKEAGSGKDIVVSVKLRGLTIADPTERLYSPDHMLNVRVCLPDVPPDAGFRYIADAVDHQTKIMVSKYFNPKDKSIET